MSKQEVQVKEVTVVVLKCKQCGRVSDPIVDGAIAPTQEYRCSKGCDTRGTVGKTKKNNFEVVKEKQLPKNMPYAEMVKNMQ